MARRRKQKQNDETLVDLVDVKDQASGFIEQNQNMIFGALVALVVIIGGIFAYKNFVQAPKLVEAQEQMYQAQLKFDQDSFAQALTNPAPGYSGFLDIIDNYGGTESANAAQYYAAVCYLNLGEHKAAMDYINAFSPTSDLFSIMKYGVQGDIYSEMNDMDNALSSYQKAASAGENEALTAYYLKKIGLWNEKNQQFQAALDAYSKIKKQYPNSPDGSDIDKYIARVSASL